MIKIFNRVRDAEKQLTKNFKAKEFFCHCGICRDQYIDLDHVKKLQEKRDKWGKSVKVTSGYRCEVWNKAVGGVEKSQHRKGTASDIQVRGMTPQEVASDCEDFNGLGRYETFTHVDSRDTKARWGHKEEPRPKLEKKKAPPIQTEPKKLILPDGPSEDDINITLEDIENQIID